MEKRTNAELVTLARRGDRDAFGLLVKRHQQMVRRIAMGMVSNEDIARELAQEAMLQAYLSLDHLRDDGRFKNWLYGITLNVCRSYIRSQKTATFSLEAIAGGLQFDAIRFSATVPDPQKAAEEQELHHLVLKAIDTLSSKNRDATLLFYYEQLSLRQVAASLGVSVGAVKGRLHKARKQLRERLLPLYSEVSHTVPVEKRRKTMIKVSVADVVKQNEFYVIVLLDEAGRRILPIWVGPYEGEAIAIHLLEQSVPRPLTHKFMANLLETIDAELEEVRVEALQENTFYAIAKLCSGDTVQEVDARPSDAIALALHTGSPIYVNGEVLEREGMDIPAEVGMTPQLGQGIGNLMKEWEKERQAAESRSCATAEEIEQAHQELIALVFPPQ
ncbi:MAG: sigma-70 family RNA polymerase sigma factor [Chloroflexi bacterium]|nr:sigma-70 family RNA polymerase sigma factor [Chloroflexota bacterium]